MSRSALIGRPPEYLHAQERPVARTQIVGSKLTVTVFHLDLDSATVRSLTVQRFGSDRTVDEYVAAYKHVITASQPVPV
jgi:hypothetical protein